MLRLLLFCCLDNYIYMLANIIYLSKATQFLHRNTLYIINSCTDNLKEAYLSVHT